MVFQYNFNDKEVLQAYLKQALPQIDGKEWRDRIHVGHEGGILYQLFEHNFTHKDRPVWRPFTSQVLLGCEQLIAAVRGYVDLASKHAQKHDFNLVQDSAVIENVVEDSYILSDVGIGSKIIHNAAELERFLNMIKTGKSDLDARYKDVCEVYASLDRLLKC